ncbi:DUF4292 domain-containing protein [Polaribacter sp. ALD11]|uniref:DUF4292 domain-containing protein n=1 Tax=Polaribacter sp. ALD11 TaxID=2058137 RepID=UPI000C31792B|nr:DUF4292 domain-containing protein [Polaribacter sp. ALD11]AUC85489.1 DUF4292 domain-containing protein [Polaribacter sp. ALD11]
MRYLKYLVVLTIVFTSCKTKKYVIDSNLVAREMSAKKVVRKHLSATFDKETIDAKLKANFNDGKVNQSISVYLKIQKDEVIWLKGTKFINVFKAKITPEKVSFYSPLEKKYFEGDFSMLEKLLGTEINFQQLQNLFLGEAILDVKKEKQNIEIVNNSYILSPQVQANFFDVFFAVNPGHFKLDHQSIVNSMKGQRLDIKYPSYKLIEDVVYPQEINIKAKQGNKLTTIDFILKSVEFNTEINTSFKIPKGYKRIQI